jgi:all-trans-8'-apo-beta-carotenal 15,15'-oxygenase
MKMGIVDTAEIPFPPLYTEIKFMEFEDTTSAPVSERLVSLPGYAFLHDFVVTENYYIIFLNPVTVDSFDYMTGTAPAASCVKWIEGKDTKMMVIPRDPSKSSRTFTLPPSFVFHHAGGYEDGDDLVVDSIHYPSMPAVGKQADPRQGLDPNVAFQSRLKRVRVHNWESNDAQITIDTLHDGYLEMVSVNPDSRRHRYVYGYSSVFEDALIGISRVDTHTKETTSWYPNPRQFLFEPIFVPRGSRRDSAQGTDAMDTDSTIPGDSADGWIICQFFCSDTSRSGFFIFDAGH